MVPNTQAVNQRVVLHWSVTVPESNHLFTARVSALRRPGERLVPCPDTVFKRIKLELNPPSNPSDHSGHTFQLQCSVSSCWAAAESPCTSTKTLSTVFPYSWGRSKAIKTPQEVFQFTPHTSPPFQRWWPPVCSLFQSLTLPLMKFGALWFAASLWIFMSRVGFQARNSTAVTAVILCSRVNGILCVPLILKGHWFPFENQTRACALPRLSEPVHLLSKKKKYKNLLSPAQSNYLMWSTHFYFYGSWKLKILKIPNSFWS